DERKRWHGRQGLLRQVIGEEQSGERDGLAAAVVDLKPIAAAGRVGHPLVNGEAGDRAETSSAVERARSGRVQCPRAGTVREAAEGVICRLPAEADGINQPAAVAQA